MTEIPTHLFIPIGVVTAALIAGFFSFLNLVISKEQKVSEFRQAWIDKLREDISKYAASINYLASTNELWVSEGTPEALKHFEAMRSTVDAASQVYTSIVLRINPVDGNKKMKQKNNEFLTALNAVKESMRNNSYAGIKQLLETLTAKAQPILKYEWERVKKGELGYRITRNVAMSIAIVGVISAAFFALHIYANKPVQVATPSNTAVERDAPQAGLRPPAPRPSP